MNELIGKTLGRYHIKESIGAGGMATVYRAYDARLEREVAIKVLPAQHALTPGFKERFLLEAKAIALLNHPHILPIYDFDFEGDLSYIVMRYASGGTLRDRLNRQSIPTAEAVEIIRQVAIALDYAHGRGVVHRDVKPGNILFDENSYVFLSDFGLAKIVGGSAELTTSGAIVGTPAYLSPEQAQGYEVDHRSDIYSLGIVLFEMVVGQTPYQAETPMAVLLKHIQEPVPSPRLFKSDLSQAVEQVILKALNKNPHDRYQTAGEMAQSLKEAAVFLSDPDVTPVILPRPITEPKELPPPKEVTPPPPPTDYPSMLLKPEHSIWASHAQKHVVEELMLQENFERLKSFIIDSEGGRFVLTGYGRFGGTSLIKSAMSKAKRELQQRGQKEGALLVFYFNVKEGDEPTQEFEIEANEFSLGKLTTQYEGSFKNVNPQTLKTGPFSHTSLEQHTFHFSLERPLGASFFNESRVTGIFTRPDFDFTRLGAELRDFSSQDKSHADLQKFVRQLTGGEVAPSKVAVILDRISHLETLETLAQFEMFKNNRVTVIAVSRKEEFDQWQNCEKRLSRIGFKKWYIPCLWDNESDYIQRIERTLLEPYGLRDSNVEGVVTSLRKHLGFVGRGAIGEVLGELKHPKYWSSDSKGNFYLRLDKLPHQRNIQHNAWMQDVLNLNWPTILANLFAGKDLDEKEDRAKIGVYHLLDWITEQQIFTKDQLLEAAYTMPITISNNLYVAHEVALNLLRVLERNRYLRVIDGWYRVVWDRQAPPKPKKVKLKISSALPERPKPVVPSPEQIVSEKVQELRVANLKNIRALLTEGFTAEELRILCYEEPEFRAVYEKLPEGIGAATLAFELVTHADRKRLIEKLLALAKEHNPARYEEYRPYY
jgi:serine/threonine protein kinase